MLNYLIISGSLNPESKSNILAHEAKKELERLGKHVELVDLKEYPLPLCGSSEAYGDTNVAILGQKVEQADAIIFAGPVYNYDMNAALKNLIEFTGKKMLNKVAGMMVAAGGHNSYMAPIGFLNSLMFDFRMLIIPRFVFATSSAFTDGALSDEKVVERVYELVGEVARVAEALKE